MGRRYDRRHQLAREAMLRAWSPGDTCPRCGHEVDPRADKLHADHDEDGGYLGLSHGSPCRVCGRRCNVSFGGIKSAQLAGKRLRERRCVVCGLPYTAPRGRTSATQETCGRQSCITELKRRNKSREGPGEPPEATGRLW
jgi:hypothetical protein